MQHSLTQPWKPPEFDIDWENPVVILKLGLPVEEARSFPFLYEEVTIPCAYAAHHPTSATPIASVNGRT
jgi:hypothetical protein